MYVPTVTWWGTDPATEMRRLQRDMSRLFGGYGAESEPYPAINAWSNNDEVVLTAEIPGVDPKSLDISVNGDQVSIAGERKLDEIEADVVCHCSERGVGKFVRVLRLPFAAEAVRVSAKYRHGILTVTLPRAEASKPKKVAITSES
jgi:HSP20 family protein